jgi:hypothetical protein
VTFASRVFERFSHAFATRAARPTRYVSCDNVGCEVQQHASEDASHGGAFLRARSDAFPLSERASRIAGKAIPDATVAASTANATAAAVERAAAAVANAHASHADSAAAVDPVRDAVDAAERACEGDPIERAAASTAERRGRREFVDVRLGKGRGRLVSARAR